MNRRSTIIITPLLLVRLEINNVTKNQKNRQKVGSHFLTVINIHII